MITLDSILIFVTLSIIFFILAFCTVLYVITSPYPHIWRDEKEKYFINGKTGKKEAFPSINSPSTLHLSVVVPAYNEEERLPPMLNECIEFLEKRTRSGFTYEIIIVSDGSTDRTVEVGQKYAKKYDNIRVLELIENRGKGGAVRLGVQSARGSLILFADADGATKFEDLERLEQSMERILGFSYIINNGKADSLNGVVCGSRAHLEKEDTAKRSYFRLLLMHGFHFLVWSLCVRGICDTQCGFKLLTRESAKILFNALHVERWAFDVEMLYIAQTLNIPISEIAVNWTEIEGSKIIPFWSWIQMGKDLCLIWLKYKIKAWKIAKSKKQ